MTIKKEFENQEDFRNFIWEVAGIDSSDFSMTEFGHDGSAYECITTIVVEEDIGENARAILMHLIPDKLPPKIKMTAKYGDDNESCYGGSTVETGWEITLSDAI